MSLFFGFKLRPCRGFALSALLVGLLCARLVRIEARLPPGMAQGSQFVLRKFQKSPLGELLEVELEFLGIVRVLDCVPELQLDFRSPLFVLGSDGRDSRVVIDPQFGRCLLQVFWRAAVKDALKRVGKLLRGLVAFVRVLGEGTRHHAIVPGRNRREQRRGRGRIVVHDLFRHRPRPAALERLLSGEELVKDDAGGKNVGAPVDLLSLDLLRRHVGGRAHHGARLGGAGLAFGVADAGHAEVGKLCMALDVDHHVGRLDVPVDDARIVCEVHGSEQFGHQADGSPDFEPLARVEGRFQLLAADVLHDDVGNLALFAEVVDLDDIRVVEPRHGLRFARKTLRVVARGRFVEIADEDGLDRDLAIQPGVEPLVHDSHRALAEDALELVPAERFDLLFGHGGIFPDRQ